MKRYILTLAVLCALLCLGAATTKTDPRHPGTRTTVAHIHATDDPPPCPPICMPPPGTGNPPGSTGTN